MLRHKENPQKTGFSRKKGLIVSRLHKKVLFDINEHDITSILKTVIKCSIIAQYLHNIEETNQNSGTRMQM